jgi:GntR family transcriptional regulator
MQIRLDTLSGIPAYRQIAAQLRTLIVEGALKPGDALPAVRRLALDLGIHFNTVAEAYRTLAQESFLEISRGHGARVLSRDAPHRAAPELAGSFRQRLRDLVAGMRAGGLTTRQVAAELRTMAEALEGR